MQTNVNITRINDEDAYSLLGTFGKGFRCGKNIFKVYYDNNKLSRPFRSHWGAGWDGWQQGILDDVSFLGSIPNAANFDGFG
jgi:hypothetical protein